ncbi:hypothetical protein ACH3XW_47730 [Acanthocheilonema viteae]
MSTTNVAAKFVNLHDYQEQSREKHKSQNNFVETGSNSSIPNDSTNSIDHTEYYTVKHSSPIYPSTSGEVYDRRQRLRNIYSAKRSAPTTSSKYCLAVKPSSFPLLPVKLLEKRPLHVSSQFYRGRTPQGELIDNLREELYGIKRNYAAMLRENIILKTRLKRSSNEIVRKDRQLQNLLIIQSKGYASNDHRGNVLAMKQKIVMLESLLKEKTNEISRLKHDREAMRIPDYQEHIADLEVQCKHCLTYVTPPPSKMRADVHSLPKRQRLVSGNNNTRKLKEAVSLLEKENDKMRSKLQIFFNCSGCSPNELSIFEREELIALIIHQRNELRKKESWKNCNGKNGRSRQKDTSLVCNQKLLPVKQKFGKPTNRLRTKNKLTAMNNGTQGEVRAEIIKIPSDDEGERTMMSKEKMTESLKVATPVEELELNADDWESDDSYASTLHGIAVDAKTENVTKMRFTQSSFRGTESISRQAEESEITIRKQEVMKTQTEHVSQRNWKKYKERENRADEHPVVDTRTERSTFEDNQNKCEEISDDIANNQFIKRDSNDCTEVQEPTEESSSDAQQNLVKKIETQEDEIKVKNAERVELKKDEVMPNFVFQSILRMTSAHLKRLELLIAKTNSYSSSP